MAIQSIHCHVLGSHVTRVTDLEGRVTKVICAEYQPNGTCRLKEAALEGGPLAQLLERASEETLDTRSTVCDLKSA